MGFGERWLQSGPLKPDAPTPSSKGPGPGATCTRQPSWPRHQDSTLHLCSPSWATWAEEAETKKGEEGDPRMRGSLFFPAPTAGAWGLDGTEGSEAERNAKGRVRVTQRETRRATDPQIQRPRKRKCAKTGRETHEVPASGRKAVRGRNLSKKGPCRERG